MRGPPLGASAKQLRGTLHAERERERKRQAAAVPSKAADEMRRCPAGLTARERRIWKSLIVAAPWLTPADRGALTLYVRASAAIDGAADLAAVSRQTSLVTQLGRQLGLTPVGRRLLGIEVDHEQPSAAGDPWAELRIVA